MIFLGLQAKQATELKMLLQLPDPKCWRHPDAPHQSHAYWIRIQKLVLKAQYRPRWACRETWLGLLAGFLEGSCFSKGRRQRYNQDWDLTKAWTVFPSWWSFKNKNNCKSLPIHNSSVCSNTNVWGILFIFLKRFPLGSFYLNIIPVVS